MPKYTREELNAMTKPELNQAYKSVRRNLFRNTNKMEKEGATFDMDMRPDIPKKITPGSVMRLQKYNDPGFRAQHANFTDVVTGKVQSWVDHIKDKRSAAARKRERAKKYKGGNDTNTKSASKVSYIQFVDSRIRWMTERVLSGIGETSTSRHEAQATRLMWNQLLDVARSTDTESALDEFLEQNSSEILSAVEVMNRESEKREVVEEAFWRLSQVLGSAMDDVYSAIDAERFQQYAGGWSVYDNSL